MSKKGMKNVVTMPWIYQRSKGLIPKLTVLVKTTDVMIPSSENDMNSTIMYHNDDGV